MSAVGELGAEFAHLPPVLTVEEAAALLRISRSHAYALARRYEETDGMEGIPVLRVGNSLRVLRWALVELLTTGRLVRLRDAVDHDQLAGQVSAPRSAKRRRASRSRVVSIDRTVRGSVRNAEQLALLPSD